MKKIMAVDMCTNITMSVPMVSKSEQPMKSTGSGPSH